jgi:hypothetical protein
VILFWLQVKTFASVDEASMYQSSSKGTKQEKRCYLGHSSQQQAPCFHHPRSIPRKSHELDASSGSKLRKCKDGKFPKYTPIYKSPLFIPRT